MVIESTLSNENTLSAGETGCLREKSTWKAEKRLDPLKISIISCDPLIAVDIQSSSWIQVF